MPATRGQRNPEVAARIAQNRPVQTGGRRPPRQQVVEPEPEDQPGTDIEPAEAPMAEFDTAEEFTDAGEWNEDLPMLFPGDVVLAKVVHTTVIDGLESWFTYGVQSRVQPDESEDDAFARVCTVANSRVIDLIVDANDRIEAETQRRAELAAQEAAERAARQRATGGGGAPAGGGGGTGRITPRSRQR